ncbi:hypothetical protein EBZ35_04865 [bacterium]|nr:hypothetical protein [bacterium]
MWVLYLISGVLALLMVQRLRRMGVGPLVATGMGVMVFLAPFWLPLLGVLLIGWLVWTRWNARRAVPSVPTVICSRCGFECKITDATCSRCGNAMSLSS